MDSTKTYLRVAIDGDDYECTICSNFVDAAKMWVALGINIARSFGLPRNTMVNIATMIPTVKIKEGHAIDMTAMLNLGGDRS